MVAALAEDLSRAGYRVLTTQDCRLTDVTLPVSETYPIRDAAQEHAALAELAQRCAATWLIAPEFEQLLWRRATWVEEAGGRLLSPDPAFIRLATDKYELNRFLATHQVPVPRNRLIRRDRPLPVDFPYPAVIKRRDGAGSVGMCRVDSRAQQLAVAELPDECLLEEFCPGSAGSVSVLCGLQNRLLLPPAEQRLSTDGRFSYLGGRLPLGQELAERAHDLARRTLDVLPTTRGYVGIDVVLGRCQDEDVVIEVNPRLTTSYVGLRQFARGNIAEWQLAIAQGQPVRPDYHARGVEFSADGSFSWNGDAAK